MVNASSDSCCLFLVSGSEVRLGPSRTLSQCPGVALGRQPHVQHICSQDLGRVLLFSPLNFLYCSQEESREVKAKT